MARKQTDSNSEPETLWRKLFGGRSQHAKQSDDGVREIAAEDRNAIRQYLLRRLSEDQEQIIEQRLLNEDDLFEELEIAEDELVDEYVDGRLSKSDGEQVKKSFLATPEGIKKQRFAKTLGRYQSDQKNGAIEPKKPSLLSRLQQSLARVSTATSPLAQAVVVLIVISVGFAVWRGFFYQSDVDQALVALNAAYRDQRSVEVRITGLDYAPFVTTRGPGTAKINENELQRAELKLLDALRKDPTPAAHHALGKVYLARNAYDDAIKELDEALKADPNNPEIFADLGAAYLEKGKIDLDNEKSLQEGLGSGKGVEELARSLDNLNKALTANPNLLEALFNRGLCHQYLGLTAQAKTDWLEYIKRDSLSPWADEARHHLRMVESQEKKLSKNKEQIFQEFLTAYNSQNRSCDSECAQPQAIPHFRPVLREL